MSAISLLEPAGHEGSGDKAVQYIRVPPIGLCLQIWAFPERGEYLDLNRPALGKGRGAIDGCLRLT